MMSWIYDTAIAVSALLMLVLIIRKPVARHFGASVAYCLWLLPAARLFMPSLSVEAQMTNATSSAVGMGSGAAFANATQVIEPASAIGQASPLASLHSLPFILALWLGGAALLFIVQMIRYCMMREDMLRDAQVIDRIGTISIVESDQIQGPLAFGLFRRFIAVPRNFTGLYGEAERKLALEHELAHHRAGDLYANLAAFIVLCLFWFNPLAWLAWSAFRFDQEAACDARVLSGADVSTRQCYGRALARSATNDLPSFAMALNSPSTVIERLRRLMMQDPSKGRRLTGRLAILAVTAVALPLTATVVPVFAEEAPKAEDAKPTVIKREKRHIISVFTKDDEGSTIDTTPDADTPFVKTIQKDGKTIVLRSNRELSEAEVAKMVAQAEASRAEAELAAAKAETAKGEAEKAEGEAEMAKSAAEGQRTHHIVRVKRLDGKTMAWTQKGGAGADMVPDIDISDIDEGCKGGDIVSTNVNGYDGKNKAAVKMVICGKGNAKLARIHAIEGLKEAQTEMKNDPQLSESIRKSVIDSLQQQIDRLEKQQSEDTDKG